MKVYEVPALIAAKTGVPVIPVRIRYRRGSPPHVRSCGLHAPARISAAGQAAGTRAPARERPRSCSA